MTRRQAPGEKPPSPASLATDGGEQTDWEPSMCQHERRSFTFIGYFNGPSCFPSSSVLTPPQSITARPYTGLVFQGPRPLAPTS